MDFNCWMCSEDATWVCDCPKNTRSCDEHLGHHIKQYKECKAEPIDSDIIEINVKSN